MAIGPAERVERCRVALEFVDRAFSTGQNPDSADWWLTKALQALPASHRRARLEVERLIRLGRVEP
jgi:hypothetical protein